MQRNHYSFIAIFSTIYIIHIIFIVFGYRLWAILRSKRTGSQVPTVSYRIKKEEDTNWCFTMSLTWRRCYETPSAIQHVFDFPDDFRLAYYSQETPCTYWFLLWLHATAPFSSVFCLNIYLFLCGTAVLNTDGNWILPEQITKFTFQSILLVRYNKSINKFVCSLLSTRHWRHCLFNYDFLRIRAKWRMAECFFFFFQISI